MSRIIFNRFVRVYSSANRMESNLPSQKPSSEKSVTFDQPTHTGQAWDHADYRTQRFDIAPKQVNSSTAQRLIAEVPPSATDESIIYCDGGHPALGHPRVYINLEKPGVHACGYCGLRFYNKNITKEEHLSIMHMAG